MNPTVTLLILLALITLIQWDKKAPIDLCDKAFYGVQVALPICL
jgi:hypothetical protein